VRELQLFGYRPPGRDCWVVDARFSADLLARAEARWRAPLKINELRTDPIGFATLPKLDAAGSTLGAALRIHQVPARAASGGHRDPAGGVVHHGSAAAS
jgi:hypothetical protein